MVEQSKKHTGTKRDCQSVSVLVIHEKNKQTNKTELEKKNKNKKNKKKNREPRNERMGSRETGEENGIPLLPLRNRSDTIDGDEEEKEEDEPAQQSPSIQKQPPTRQSKIHFGQPVPVAGYPPPIDRLQQSTSQGYPSRVQQQPSLPHGPRYVDGHLPLGGSNPSTAGHQIIVIRTQTSEPPNSGSVFAGCLAGFYCALLGLSCLIWSKTPRSYFKGWIFGFLFLCVLFVFAFVILEDVKLMD